MNILDHLRELGIGVDDAVEKEEGVYIKPSPSSEDNHKDLAKNVIKEYHKS